MATVSGRVVFDRNRSATIDAGDSGIANVPVVLQNTATNVGLAVLTDANGNYSFINVPNGNYRIVEAFGTGGVPTPGNFATAVVIPIPVGANPPISFATNPPPGSTNLDSLTPDTLFVTVTGADLTNENFLNGPVIYTPIQTILDPCTTVSNINLITDADNGTFGFFPPGTPANTGAPVEPYPGVTPDFTYVLPDPTKFTPIDGEYTVQNIMTNAMSNVIGAWWRIADHTTGNETGRMMVVNGFEPGAVFFRSTVPVTPNTNFLFSTWILNLFKVMGFPPPQLGVRILGQNGNVLFQQTLGVQIPVNTNAPEWKQIGTVINSLNNTQLTVEFFSEGEAVIGNDYAIDDVALNEILVPTFTPVKTSSQSTAFVGDVVTYTVKLTNTCTSPLTNVFFKDILPLGLLFIPGSVTVNGVSELGVDPNIGFPLANVPGATTVTVTFQVRVEGIPNPNPAINIATIDYSYTPVEGGIPLTFSQDSNPVPLLVEEVPGEADVSVVKTASPNPVAPGGVLTYTIVVSNAGPADAENVVLTDSIPSSIIGPEFSIDGGLTFNPWPGTLSLGTVQDQTSRVVIIRGTVSSSATGIITNTANVTSTTPDPNPANNTSTVNTEVTQVVAEADVSVVKIASPNPVAPGGVLTYTIVVANAGPNEAENVVLTDSIPSSIIGPEFSIDGGLTFNPWPGTLSLGTLLAGTSRTILIIGTVSSSATGTITNTATVTSTTPDPNPANNTSTVVTEVTAVPGEADISVVKTASPNPVTAGEVITYTLVVSNAGPADAQNVIVNDNVSSSIIGPEFSTNGGVTFTPWPGSIDIGTLAAGTSRTILIRGTVSQSATGCINNTAIVTSTTPDPNFLNNVSSICVEVQAAVPGEADVSVVKTASPNPVAPGGVLAYTIVVANAGPNEAQNVVLTDSIPSSIIGSEFSIDGGVTFNPWPGTLSLGTLAAGTSKTILIIGTVSSSATGTITNTANVTSTTPDPNPSNNTSTVVTEVTAVPGEADISVVKTASPNPVTAGGVLTYTLVVANAGPNDAQNVIVNDNVSSSIIGPEFSTNGGVTFTPWPGSIDIGTLAAGTSRTILIRGTVSQSATGCINNTAIVTSTTPDPNFLNNVSSICVEVQAAVPGEADVSIVKTASPNPVTPGGVLTYTLVVSNAGPADAQNVIVNDNVSSSIIGPEFSTNGGVTFTPWPGSIDIGTLAAGTSRTILIRGTVSQSATGCINNTAIVTSTTPDPNFLNNVSSICVEVQAAVPGEADVSVVKTASPNPVAPGGVLAYTIVVSNAGPNDAQNVIVTDSIPSSIIGPEFSTNGGVTFNPWPGTLSIGTLPVGTSRTILIIGTVSSSAAGTITNTANVTSTTPDPNPSNNTSTAVTGVTAVPGEADVSIVKTASPNPVAPGKMLTYTLVVSNAGPNDAQNVIVDDNVSSNIIGPEFSVNGGVTFNPWPGSIDIGTLPAGTSRTILIRGIVSQSAIGCINNTAIAVSTTPDPNLRNNTSAICVEVRESADVSVKKKCFVFKEKFGVVVSYKIIVSNAGPSDARNVVLEDRIPNEISNVMFSIDEGMTCKPWTGCFNIGTLKAGASITIIIEGTLKSSCKKEIVNTAKVRSKTFDPDLTNNTSTAVVRFRKRNSCDEGFEDFECDECSECIEFEENDNCNCIEDDSW